MTIKEFLNYKNIWQSPITSVLGVALLFMVGRKYWETFAIDANDIVLLGFAWALIFAKDPTKVKFPPAGGAALIAIALLSSCVTPRACLEKFGSEVRTVTVRDTLIDTVKVELPKREFSGTIEHDSLQMLLSGQIDSLSRVSDNKKQEAIFWRDQYSKALHFKCIENPDTVEVIREVPFEVKAECPPTVVVDPEQVLRWYEKLWKGFQFLSACLVLAGFAFLLIVIVVKKPF